MLYKGINYIQINSDLNDISYLCLLSKKWISKNLLNMLKAGQNTNKIYIKF